MEVLKIIPNSIVGIDLGIKDLSVRNYTCLKCNHELDRNQNAAVNMLFEVKTIYGSDKEK